MSVLQIPLWIVALILAVLAAFLPHRALLPLSIAFLAAGFLVAEV